MQLATSRAPASAPLATRLQTPKTPTADNLEPSQVWLATLLVRQLASNLPVRGGGLICSTERLSSTCQQLFSEPVSNQQWQDGNKKKQSGQS